MEARDLPYPSPAVLRRFELVRELQVAKAKTEETPEKIPLRDSES